MSHRSTGCHRALGTLHRPRSSLPSLGEVAHACGRDLPGAGVSPRRSGWLSCPWCSVIYRITGTYIGRDLRDHVFYKYLAAPAGYCLPPMIRRMEASETLTCVPFASGNVSLLSRTRSGVPPPQRQSFLFGSNTEHLLCREKTLGRFSAHSRLPFFPSLTVVLKKKKRLNASINTYSGSRQQVFLIAVNSFPASFVENFQVFPTSVSLDLGKFALKRHLGGLSLDRQVPLTSRARLEPAEDY